MEKFFNFVLDRNTFADGKPIRYLSSGKEVSLYFILIK